MILAIDQSIKHSGFCIFKNEEDYILKLFEPERDNHKEYLVKIYDYIDHIVKEYDIDLIAREDYAYGAKTNILTQLAEIGGLIDYYALRHNKKHYIVPVYTWKKFIFGERIKKDTKYLLSFYKKTGILFENDNLADAYGIAKFIYSYLYKEPKNKIEEDIFKKYETYLKRNYI